MILERFLLKQESSATENQPENRVCRKCNQLHTIFYRQHKNNTVHLVMWCNSFRTFISIPFEKDLLIPIKESKNILRINENKPIKVKNKKRKKLTGKDWEFIRKTNEELNRNFKQSIRTQERG